MEERLRSLDNIQRYPNYAKLVKGRLLNGGLDLRHIALTEEQIEELQQYIRTHILFSSDVKKIYLEDLIIVDTKDKSSIRPNFIFPYSK